MGVYVYLCAVSFKCRVVNFKWESRGQVQVPRESQLARTQTGMHACIHTCVHSKLKRKFRRQPRHGAGASAGVSPLGAA